MYEKALGKHGLKLAVSLLLTISVQAAPTNLPVQIAVGNPLPNSLVAGRITLGIAYHTLGPRISAFTVYVDDTIQYSRAVSEVNPRGIEYLELDTRTIPDGNHTVRVVAANAKGVQMAIDAVDIVVRNGVAGGVDIVPPLVQFRGLSDGDVVSGKITIDVLAEDNQTKNPLVALFVDNKTRKVTNVPPYSLDLDTVQFLDPVTKRGKIHLEVWAYDDAKNLGKAKPIDLTVVPPGSENQTRVQDDPAAPRPLVITPLPPATDITGPPDLARGDLQSALLPGPRASHPSLRGSASKNPAKKAAAKSVTQPVIDVKVGKTPPREYLTQPLDPVIPGTARVPQLGEGRAEAPQASSAEPGSPKIVQRPMPMGGPQMAIGIGRQPSLGQLREQVPSVTRREPARSETRSTAADHEGSPEIAGPEPTRPAVAPKPHVTVRRSIAARPATKPGQMAAVPKLNVRPIPAAPAPMPMDTQVLPAAPPMLETPAAGSLAGTRATMPSGVDSPATERPVKPTPPQARVAKAPTVQVSPELTRPVPKSAKGTAARGDTLIVVPSAKPGARKWDVYRMKPRAASAMQAKGGLPEDRSYRVRRGDTITAVAKRFRVTGKSIMVANGLIGKAPRVGSIIHVPGTFDVVLNNKQVDFDVSPRVENGMALAPFRQIMEHAGGVVVWYGDRREIRAQNDTADVKLHIGSREAMVNQVIVVMDREAFLDSGRTIVPISFFEKALDLKAEYDVKTGTISLAKR